MSASEYIAFSATQIYPFYGVDSRGLPTERAIVAGIAELRAGEILRVFIDQNPIAIINKLMMKFGSRIIFQYLQNRDGAVIIDFMKIRA